MPPREHAFALPSALASGFRFVPRTERPFPSYGPLLPPSFLRGQAAVAVTGGPLGWLPTSEPGVGGGERGELGERRR